MLRTLPRALSATVVVLIVLCAGHTEGEGVLPWVVALLSAAVCLFGAWCAPVSGSGRATDGSVLGRMTRAHDAGKASQVVAAGVAMGAVVVLNLVDPGLGIIVGIVVAGMVGLALPATAEAD